MSLLIVPGAPYFLLALAAALCAGLVLSLRPQPVAGAAAARPSVSAQLIGQMAALPLAGGIAAAALALDLRGTPQMLFWAAALAAYLGLGVVLPRLPETRRQREDRLLRRLVPGLIEYIRIGISSFEPPLEIMRRYVQRPNPRIALMQTLVASALDVSASARLRPFAALLAVARGRTCRELIDLADALAQAEAEGSRMDAVLQAQQATVELILQSEFRRMVRRRTMYLLLMVAISLVIGILINLLFVMTGGGNALLGIG